MKKTKESVEGRVKKRAKRNQVRNTVLTMAYVAVVAGAAIMMPNALRLIKQVENKIGPSPKLKRRVSQVYSELISKGLFERKLTKNGPAIVLTRKGEDLAAGIALKEHLHLEQPKKWDYKWRVVMFDVWERRRAMRDELRRTLSEFGFIKIQNSVWAYPFPCEKLLIFLRTSLKLGKGVLYMVVEEIENDENLRRHFNLPQ
jgi:hypothetical protein